MGKDDDILGQGPESDVAAEHPAGIAQAGAAQEPDIAAGTESKQEQPGEPQYVTREELEAAQAELHRLAKDVYRAYQGLADRTANKLRKELSERLTEIEKTLSDPDVRAYLGEDAQTIIERKRLQAVGEFFSKPVDQIAQEPEPEPVNYMEHPVVRAAIRLTGVRPGDPEWVRPEDFADKDPEDWAEAMRQAGERKKQRLARTTPRPEPKGAATQHLAGTPQEQAPRKVAPVSINTGNAPRHIDPLDAVREYIQAKFRGDTEEARRLEAIIQAAARGGTKQ